MKKNIYFLAGMLSLGALFTGCDDDDFGKAVTITVENATNLESDVFGVDVTEGQSVQLKPFIMLETSTILLITLTGYLTNVPEPSSTLTIMVSVPNGNGMLPSAGVVSLGVIKPSALKSMAPEGSPAKW